MSGNVIPPPSGYSPHARFALLAGYDGSDWRSISVDSLGRLSITGDSTLESYKISDTDATSDPKYYGYIKEDGSWYIMKETTSAESFRYTKGTSDFITGFTNRAAHSYGYYDAIF